MKSREVRYHSGEEIRPGDRVTWAGRPGIVLFVMGSNDNPVEWAGWPEWLADMEDGGFMLDVEGVGMVFERDGDEDLEFLGRGRG